MKNELNTNKKWTYLAGEEYCEVHSLHTLDIFLESVLIVDVLLITKDENITNKNCRLEIAISSKGDSK